MRDRETGGRLIFDMKRRRRTTLLKEASVRPGQSLLVSSSRSEMWSQDGLRTRKEAVEFHQELEVDIVALGGTSMSALDVVTVEIDTCRVKPSSAIWFNACSKWAAWSGSADGASIARKRKISNLCFSLAHSG